MPAKSEKQRRFFALVRGIQTGKIPSNKVSSKIKKVAKNISAKDAHDFAVKPINEITSEAKKRMVKILKGIVDTNMLNEEEDNPIAKSFIINDDFDTYIKRFQSYPFSDKELEAVDNFNKFSKKSPNVINSNKEIKYDTTDEFGNNTSIVIEKLKENNQYVYTAFEKESSSNDSSSPSGENNEAGKNNTKNKITITKSILFTDDIRGGEILLQFLKNLDI
jgi:hypothetical protein